MQQMKHYLDYSMGSEEERNWIITETDFDIRYQGKCESIFSLGNGYLGLRSATEESYYGQVRNLFVAGSFNKATPSEVTELPNAADMAGMDIYIDGELFSLTTGAYSGYTRSLNLRTGELVREFEWTSRAGKRFSFLFKRFASMDHLHTFCSNVRISHLGCEADIRIISGINGQMTNSGSQHFEEGEKRIYDGKYLQR